MSQEEKPLKFRSVLPHELLPKEDNGYIHLQGAFEPKKNKKKKDDSENDDMVWNRDNSSGLGVEIFLSKKQQALRRPMPNECYKNYKANPSRGTTMKNVYPAGPCC
jgi:hypothetical protein